MVNEGVNILGAVKIITVQSILWGQVMAAVAIRMAGIAMVMIDLHGCHVAQLCFLRVSRILMYDFTILLLERKQSGTKICCI